MQRALLLPLLFLLALPATGQYSLPALREAAALKEAYSGTEVTRIYTKGDSVSLHTANRYLLFSTRTGELLRQSAPGDVFNYAETQADGQRIFTDFGSAAAWAGYAARFKGESIRYLTRSTEGAAVFLLNKTEDGYKTRFRIIAAGDPGSKPRTVFDFGKKLRDVEVYDVSADLRYALVRHAPEESTTGWIKYFYLLELSTGRRSPLPYLERTVYPNAVFGTAFGRFSRDGASLYARMAMAGVTDTLLTFSTGNAALIARQPFFPAPLSNEEDYFMRGRVDIRRPLPAPMQYTTNGQSLVYLTRFGRLAIVAPLGTSASAVPLIDPSVSTALVGSVDATAAAQQREHDAFEAKRIAEYEKARQARGDDYNKLPPGVRVWCPLCNGKGIAALKVDVDVYQGHVYQGRTTGTTNKITCQRCGGKGQIFVPEKEVGYYRQVR